jgi:phage baseplate assembly protein W
MNKLTKDAITSNLLLLLLTQRGERYYHPNYGTDLLKYIFEPKDNLTLSEIEREIKQTVSDFIPEVTITRIDMFSDGIDDMGQPLNENEIKVVIDFIYSENTFSDSGRLELNF